MSETLYWWILAGVLVALELVSGSFYLLMLALGAAAAALGAWLGIPLAAQIALAAMVGGGAVWLWHQKKSPREAHATPTEATDPNLLDVGATVLVTEWQADGNTRVHYRGSDWTARLADGAPVQAGPHRIVAIESNRLVITPR
ncbi:MAG: NfeD family protein [Aquabacterium sp.]|jgi:membrane protein implicated in regulation of membrane protease activity